MCETNLEGSVTLTLPEAERLWAKKHEDRRRLEMSFALLSDQKSDMPTLLHTPVSSHAEASKAWHYAQEAMTEAVETVQAWWATQETKNEAVAEDRVDERSIQPSEAQVMKQKKETFMGGLLGAGVLSPGTLALCILLL